MSAEIVLTIVVAFLLIFNLVHSERQQNKHDETIATIIKRLDYERGCWEKEKQMLLERMLYPELNYTTYKAMNKEKPEKKPEPKKELV